MEDVRISVYHENPVFLDLNIVDGCLRMDSEVFGPSYDSEAHYNFSKEETEKLFQLISVEDFVELCRKEHLEGMERFLKKHRIDYDLYVI